MHPLIRSGLEGSALATRLYVIQLLCIAGTMIDLLNRFTGYSPLTPSEAYQYPGFPLIGLSLLFLAIWRLQPGPSDELGASAAPSWR